MRRNDSKQRLKRRLGRALRHPWRDPIKQEEGCKHLKKCAACKKIDCAFLQKEKMEVLLMVSTMRPALITTSMRLDERAPPDLVASRDEEVVLLEEIQKVDLSKLIMIMCHWRRQAQVCDLNWIVVLVNVVMI